MGEKFGTGLPKHFDCQPSYLNSSVFPFNLGHQNPISSNIGHNNNMVMKTGTFPRYGTSELPQSWLDRATELHRWLHPFSHFRSGYTPTLDAIRDKITLQLDENLMENVSGDVCKRLFIIDQSGDQTMVFSALTGAPVQCLTSLTPKPDVAYNFSSENIETKMVLNRNSKPVLDSDFGQDIEVDVQTEMHEDTEELNALLYSDDENESDEADDEVTSTGHSPSTMIDNNRQEWFEGRVEEVASSAGPTKKRKIFHKGYDEPSLLDDTASSFLRSFEDEYGIELSNGKEKDAGISKRTKDKIRESVTILQNIIPGDGKGKEPIRVLDEAIEYLKLLKHRAKTLGLDSR